MLTLRRGLNDLLPKHHECRFSRLGNFEMLGVRHPASARAICAVRQLTKILDSRLTSFRLESPRRPADKGGV